MGENDWRAEPDLGASAFKNPGSAIVYGAGAFGQALAKVLASTGTRVDRFIDRASTSDYVNGVRLVRPGDESIDLTIPVLVSVMGYPEVARELRDQGHVSVVPTEEVFGHFPDALREFTSDGSIWRSATLSEKLDPHGIDSLRFLLAEPKSQRVLDNLIAFRRSPSLETYPWPETYDWYFPPDIPVYPSKGTISVVDCGAYDGDSLAAYVRHFPGRLDRYLAIEANPSNAMALRTWAEAEGRPEMGGPHRLEILNLAISDAVGQVRMSDEGTASSAAPESTESPAPLDRHFTVSTARLDDIARDWDWTLIKMDIEGAEHDALIGARELIQSRLPGLAISVYHCPDDLWRLPLLIESTAPEAYDFYLRQEGHWGSETVCYALPKSRTR